MVAEKIISLNLRTRRLCKRCDNGLAISQRMRFLFLLRSDTRTPRELVDELSIAKPNLTILAQAMISEGLIEKGQFDSDKRAVYYKITELGEETLNSALQRMDRYIVRMLGDKEASRGDKKLDPALEFLELLDR